ncbi:hypothetical protein [Allorhodopirellula heiligendammensis]|uniref:Uncharacterized protein n=1 Tax=Allorhodopirellula heiligendammensis TaxID=2714739 RepID=A0A5C6C348_9BACT|nr:hypothetical protein [Allorhodopirellula heiligendammensis]TWU18437.1 hypothetical protein Poly21_05990 [Allorhodopirellula heiligendammensis]
MSETKQPDRESFTADWLNHETSQMNMVLFYSLYLGGLAIFGIAVRVISPTFWSAVSTIIAAIGYVIFVPILSIRWIQTRDAAFIATSISGVGRTGEISLGRHVSLLADGLRHPSGSAT